MKRFLALLALLAAPNLALARPTSTQQTCKKPPLPNAQYLLDHLYAPYEAARTFHGTFDILIKSDDPKNLVSEIHSKTLFRFDAKGDLAGQNSTTQYISRADPNQRQTMQSVDDGRAAKIIFKEQKVWWSSASERDKSPFLSTLLKPLLDGVVQVLNKTPNFVPVVSRGVDAGRPVFVLTAKNTDILRVVVDAQTRALRSFELTGNLSIRGSNQFFDEPIGEEEFAWTPPADFKRIEEGDIALPAFLGATFQNRPIKVAPTPPQN